MRDQVLSFRRERPSGATHMGVHAPNPFDSRRPRNQPSSGQTPSVVRETRVGRSKILPSLTTTSDRARLPAELKHINKRRKKNQQGFP